MTNSDTPRPPDRIRSNPIRTADDWDEQRRRAREDPGAFHGDIAKRELHWFLPDDGAWASLDADAETWTGFEGCMPTELDYDAEYEPWDVAFDDSDPPL